MAEERQVWESLRLKLLKDASEEKDRFMSLMSRERAEYEEQVNRLNSALSEANQTHLLELARVKKDLEVQHAVSNFF